MSNYHKFSPIPQLVEKEQWPPYKRDSSKWVDFIKQEEFYFDNGFDAGGDHITGAHYFALNYCKIGITDSRGNKVPTFRYYADAQREFYDKVDYCYNNEKNLIGLKGRDKGWTYDVAALTQYNMQTQPHSSVMALFPGGTSVAKPNFRKAYDMAYNEMDFDFKYPTMKKTEGKNQDKIIYGWEEEVLDAKTGKGTGIKKTCGPQTTLDLLTAVDSSVVRSGRSKLIIVEELGEIKGAKEIVGVADANMREGARKFGIIIAGGTSNCFNEGFEDFKDIWYNPEQFGFVKIFIPAHKQYWGYVNLKTGESDMDGAKEHRMAIRESKKGRDLIIEKHEYPFTEDEAFYEGVNSPYDVDRCNTQIARIISDVSIRNSIQRGNLYPKKDSKGNITPVFEIEPNGKFEVFKHPDKSLKYPIVGGLDSYRLAKVTDSPSKGAIEFYVPFQGMNTPGSYPACVYWERPEDKEVFFMDALLATIWYDTKILVELTDEDIIAFFKTHNALNRLKERPNIIKSAYSKAENKYGILPTVHNMAMAAEYSIKEFNGNYDQIVFVELLREMIKFAPDVNTDRLWAHHWAVLHAMDNMKVLEEYRTPKREKTFSPFTVVSGSGNLKVVRTIEEARRMGLVADEPSINRR